MSINLVTKYSPKIEEDFELSSLVFGKGTAKYDFTGAKTVKSLSPITVDLVDYNIEATSGSRFGDFNEMEDELNEYTISKDRAFNITIDKGNNTNQLMVKAAGRMLKKQVREKVIPELDKYALKQFCETTGIQSYTDGSLTSDTIVPAIAAGVAALVNEKVPVENLIGWIGATEYSKLVLTNKLTYLQNAGGKAFGKGIVAECQGVKFVRVPDSYMPTGVNFVIANDSCLMPVKKLETLRILTENPLLDGSNLQGRVMYDAFVLKQKVKGVYTSRSADISA